jgi:Cu(I)/Ag(I) efflux system membrane protein CusA/SilA
MIARIVELCARRRLAVLVAVALCAAAAVYSIRHLRQDALPDLGQPQVLVFTEWMGRSPVLVEDQVTYPIVSTLSGAPKVTAARGSSMFGMSFVQVVFEEGTDLYWARERVKESLDSLRVRLPEGVTPALGPDATSTGWAFQYVLTDPSGRHSLDELRTFQDSTLRYAIGQVPGVAEVASVGGFERQYQVTIDPAKLRAYGLSLEQVIARIRDSNGDVGGRLIELSGREYYVQGRGYVQNPGEIERIAIAPRPSGGSLLLKDLGSVRFGPDLRRGLLDWNGQGDAVGGIVIVRQGENTLEVIGRVKQRIKDLERTLPTGVKVEIAYDRTGVIERAIHALGKTLVEEGIVVALVILLFLAHFRSALLPILSIPLSVGLAAIPMALFDIPATILSLGGIAIAIGATVDAEIVTIEASHRKLAAAGPGADREKLLAEASREVTPAIFFSLLVIAVAFLPVFALTGQAGQLFRPLALTKTLVMLAAALVSITFAPALRGWLLRGPMQSEERQPLSRAIVRLYEPFVFVALRRPRSTVAIGLLAVLSAIPLARRLGGEFMPEVDEGDLLYMPTTLPSLSAEEARRQVQIQDRILAGFPEVASVFGKAGRADTATDAAPLSMVETTIQLKPQNEWPVVPVERWYSSWAPAPLARALGLVWPQQRRITKDELVAQMNEAVRLPGWTSSFTMPIKARVDMLATGIRTPLGIKVMGNDLLQIEKAGLGLEALLKPLPGARSVLYERNQGGLYVDIVPNRSALSLYGLTVGDLERNLEAAVGGTMVGTAVAGRDRFPITVRYPQDLRTDVAGLRRILVPLPRGAQSGAPAAASVALPPVDDHTANHHGLGAAPTASAQSAGSATSSYGLSGPIGPRQGFVELGQVADVRIVGGPPMVRDEGGLLTGYVYVDVDTAQRDLASFVDDAKDAVKTAVATGKLRLAAGTSLSWTGQYEEMEKTSARLWLLVPLTLALVALLLFLHFKNLVEVLIVLLSVPFALPGSIWLLWLLDYRLSTPVWVGLIALVGLATQTGILMILYLDNAYQRHKQEGRIHDLESIIRAHMEGTVQRVRPKLMTVAVMLAGLLPVFWSTGSGTEVMKRVAAPMVGGLFTSLLLTLEIIPVVYTYWRQEQLLWERLSGIDPHLFMSLRARARAHSAGWALLAVTAGAFFSGVPLEAVAFAFAFAASLVAGAARAYLVARRDAFALVWPKHTPAVAIA